MRDELVKEKKLLEFYKEMVSISQIDLRSLTIFFEQSFTSMILGHSIGDEKLCSREAYEFLFILNFGLNKDIVYPFSIVDEKYYVGLLDSSISLNRMLTFNRLYNDLRNGIRDNNTWKCLGKDSNGIINIFNDMLSLGNLFRKGWINRGVPDKYYESDAVHTAQMFGLASAYFTLFKPDYLDYNKVLEMILIHEVGEIIVGDITELETIHENKHDMEANAVRKIFSKISCGEYFTSLWEEFEQRETEEAKFVYELDKLDPVIKAKYLDEELGRTDLAMDFLSYEEKRETFKNSKLKKVYNVIRSEIGGI